MASREDKIARKIREHEAANNKDSSTDASPKDSPSDNGDDGEMATPPVVPSNEDDIRREIASQQSVPAAASAATSAPSIRDKMGTTKSEPENGVASAPATDAKPSFQDRAQREMASQGKSAAASTDALVVKSDSENEVDAAPTTPQVAKPSFEDGTQREMAAGTAATAPSSEADREPAVATNSNEDAIRRKLGVAEPSPATQPDDASTPQQPATREERASLSIQEVNALRDDPPPGYKQRSTIAALPPHVIPEEGHCTEQYNGRILAADFTFEDDQNAFRRGDFIEEDCFCEGMAYVVPEDDPDDVLISGMVIDEDLEQKEFQINKKLAIKRVVCSSGIFFAVILVVLIPAGVLVWGKNTGTKAPTPSPSRSPSSTPSLAPTSVRLDQLGQKLSAISDATLFRDKTTPQFKALYWLSYEDDVDMNADNVVQRYVMALFYYALNGDSWTLCSKGSGCKCNDGSATGVACGTIFDSKPFLSDSHECDWYRLKCNDAQEITSIRFDNTCNGLKGEIPDEMRHLTRMTKLGLGNEYKTWKRVQDNVGADQVAKENRKAHLNEISGTIPDYLTGMPNLVHVVFAKNLFTGTIPDSLYEIKSLRSLLLNRNSLDGTISSKIEQLSELRIADFSGNALSGNVPMEFEKLTDLNLLRLHDNDFNGTVPVPLCGFEKLKGKITADCNATRGVEIECSPGCCNCDPVDT